VRKAVFLFFLSLAGLLAYFYFDFELKKENRFISPLARETEKSLPLAKYEFEALSERGFLGSQIKLEEVIKEEENYTSYLFSFISDGKKVTGQANIPKGNPSAGGFPVVLMLRGYADDEIYFTGLGTRKAAGVFAENGFISLAPDFLGFGGSDSSSSDILEARFERPVTILNLLASIESLEKADKQKIAMWGHSNGGQIALSVLEICQEKIPTTLWAPVTKGFPEAILAYMGEVPEDEEEKKLWLEVKEKINDFTKEYNPAKFSIDAYFDRISAPLQVHQGGGDTLVPIEWSDEFVEKLKNLDKEVLYFTYPGDDHNLSQNWDLVVSRDLSFFKEKLGI